MRSVPSYPFRRRFGFVVYLVRSRGLQYMPVLRLSPAKESFVQSGYAVDKLCRPPVNACTGKLDPEAVCGFSNWNHV